MYRKMSVKDWIEVEDNPIQRDTERHAARAKHLLTPHPTHQFVFAAEMPSGNLIKLDGHTRALIWKRKDVEPPPHLLVGIIPVHNREEAEQLYKDFDSKEALETMQEKISGAYRKQNFQPTSALLQRGSITSAMRISYGVLIGLAASTAASGSDKGRNGKTYAKGKRLKDTDIYRMVNEFSYELHALDSFGLRQGSVSSGVISAFVLSWRKYGHRVLPFWTGVFGNTGDKKGHQMDAIQATVEVINKRRQRGHGGTGSQADLCARCLTGVEGFVEERIFTRAPTPLDTTGYLDGHEQPKERLIKAADVKKKAA